MPLEQWEKDPEFRALPRSEKAKILGNYFDQNMTDDEFRALPVPEQQQIKRAYLADKRIIPSFRKLPEEERSIIQKIGDFFGVSRKEKMEPSAIAEAQIAVEALGDPGLSDVKSIIDQNKDVPFVKRIREPEKYPRLYADKHADEIMGEDRYSTHKMAWAEVTNDQGRSVYLAFPTIEMVNGELKDLQKEGLDPVKEAVNSDNFIEFNTPEEADYFTKHYKEYWRDDLDSILNRRTVEEYKTQVYPEAKRIRRALQLGKDVQAGALGTVEGMAGFVEWLSDGKIGKQLSNEARVWQHELLPEDPNFLDEIMSGLASTAIFFIPGLGVSRAMGALGKISVKLAQWSGAGAMAMTEAATEAGQVYRDKLRDSGDLEAAEDAANITFWLNIPIITLTDKLGYFGEKGRLWRRKLVTGMVEATQESSQEVISTKAKGEELKLKDLVHSGGVGGIVGILFGGAGDVRISKLSQEERKQVIDHVAKQYSDGNLNDSDLAAIKDEFPELREDVDGITKTTKPAPPPDFYRRKGLFGKKRTTKPTSREEPPRAAPAPKPVKPTPPEGGPGQGGAEAATIETKPKAKEDLTNAEGIRGHEGQVLPGETGRVEGEKPPQAPKRKGKEEAHAEREGEGGANLEQPTQGQPRGEVQLSSSQTKLAQSVAKLRVSETEDISNVSTASNEFKDFQSKYGLTRAGVVEVIKAQSSGEKITLGEAQLRAEKEDVRRESERMFISSEGEAEKINAAAEEADQNPTDAQIEAGNYKKGHIKIEGLDISIENPAGSYRESKPDAPQEWRQKLHSHYGYVRGVEGNDGDQVDVFINPDTKDNIKNLPVFVVNQTKIASDKFDEHKILIGYDSIEAAKAAYLSNYERGWETKGLPRPQAGFPPIKQFADLEELKGWLAHGDMKSPVMAGKETKKPPKTKPQPTIIGQKAEETPTEEEIAGQKIADQVNKQLPGYSLKYDGFISEQAKTGGHQFTTNAEGDFDGITFYTKDIKPDTVLEALKDRIRKFGGEIPGEESQAQPKSGHPSVKAVLAGDIALDIERTVESKETGEPVKIKQDAKEAYEEIQAKINIYDRMLTECL